MPLGSSRTGRGSLAVVGLVNGLGATAAAGTPGFPVRIYSINAIFADSTEPVRQPPSLIAAASPRGISLRWPEPTAQRIGWRTAGGD